jgi:hypothetical protein
LNAISERIGKNSVLLPGTARQIHALLSSKERLRFIYVVLAALVMTALDLVGIGAIVAFMAVRPSQTWFLKIVD